jgi:hypothetical protein
MQEKVIGGGERFSWKQRFDRCGRFQRERENKMGVTDTHTHVDASTHAFTNTFSLHTHPLSLACIRPRLCHKHTFFLSLVLVFNIPHTVSNTHTRAQTLSLSLPLSLSHTHTLSNASTLSHSLFHLSEVLTYTFSPKH